MICITEPNQVLNLLYNEPTLLDRAVKTGLLREMEVIFMDDPKALGDFTKVKELYKRYGSPHLLEVLTRPDIQLSQEPIYYDRQSKKYYAPDQLVEHDLGTLINRPTIDDFVPAVKDYINYTRERKLEETNMQIRDELLSSQADITLLLQRRDVLLGKLKSESLVKEWSDVIDENDAYGDKPKIYTGIDGLDEKVLMQEGNILTIGATPGGGKTSMVNQFIANWMMNNPNDYSCMYFSLENDGRETQRSMMDYVSSLKPYRDDIPSVKKAMKQWRLSYCCDLFDIGDIVAEIKQKLVMDPRLKYIVIDYIQLVGDRTAVGNEVTILARVMEQLKCLKTKNLFIVILAQFDKSSAKEKENPSLYSLKGSGTVAEISSYVLINMRAAQEEENGMVAVKCFVVKSRRSRKCEIPLMFNGRQKRFYTVSDDGLYVYDKEDARE